MYKEIDLFERLVNLKAQTKTLSEDIKAVKGDFTFSEDNTQGFDKETVKAIDKAATLFVKQNFDDVKSSMEMAFSFYESLSGEE